MPEKRRISIRQTVREEDKPEEQMKRKLYSTILGLVDNANVESNLVNYHESNFRRMQDERNLSIAVNQILGFENNHFTKFLKGTNASSSVQLINPLDSIMNSRLPSSRFVSYKRNEEVKKSQKGTVRVTMVTRKKNKELIKHKSDVNSGILNRKKKLKNKNLKKSGSELSNIEKLKNKKKSSVLKKNESKVIKENIQEEGENLNKVELDMDCFNDMEIDERPSGVGLLDKNSLPKSKINVKKEKQGSNTFSLTSFEKLQKAKRLVNCDSCIRESEMEDEERIKRSLWASKSGRSDDNDDDDNLSIVSQESVILEYDDDEDQEILEGIEETKSRLKRPETKSIFFNYSPQEANRASLRSSRNNIEDDSVFILDSSKNAETTKRKITTYRDNLPMAVIKEKESKAESFNSNDARFGNLNKGILGGESGAEGESEMRTSKGMNMAERAPGKRKSYLHNSDMREKKAVGPKPKLNFSLDPHGKYRQEGDEKRKTKKSKFDNKNILGKKKIDDSSEEKSSFKSSIADRRKDKQTNMSIKSFNSNLKNNLKFFKIWDNMLKNKRKSTLAIPRFSFLISFLIILVAFMINHFDELLSIKRIYYLNGLIFHSALLKISLGDVLNKVYLSEYFRNNKEKAIWLEPDFINTEAYGSTRDLVEEVFYPNLLKESLEAFDSMSYIRMLTNDYNAEGDSIFESLSRRVMQGSEPSIRFEFNRLDDYLSNFLVNVIQNTKDCYNRFISNNEYSFCDYSELIKLIEKENLIYIIQRMKFEKFEIFDLEDRREKQNLGDVTLLRSLIFIGFLASIISFIIRFYLTVKVSKDLYSTLFTLTPTEINFMMRCNKHHLKSVENYSNLSTLLHFTTQKKLQTFSVMSTVKRFKSQQNGFHASRNIRIMRNKIKMKSNKRFFFMGKGKVILILTAILVVFLGLFWLNFFMASAYYNLVKIKLKLYEGYYMAIGDTSMFRLFNVVKIFGDGNLSKDVNDLVQELIVIKKNKISQKITLVDDTIYASYSDTEAERKFIFEDVCASETYRLTVGDKFDCKNFLGGVLTKGFIFYIHQAFNNLKSADLELKQLATVSQELKINSAQDAIVFSEYLSSYLLSSKFRIKDDLEELVRINFDKVYNAKIFVLVFLSFALFYLSFYSSVEIYKEFKDVFEVFRVIYPVIFEGNGRVRMKMKKYFELDL